MPCVFRILEMIPQRKLLGKMIFKNGAGSGGGPVMRQAGKGDDLNFCDLKSLRGGMLAINGPLAALFL